MICGETPQFLKIPSGTLEGVIVICVESTVKKHFPLPDFAARATVLANG